MRLTPGWSANSTLNWAKSTCACSPGGVSKRTSRSGGADGAKIAHAIAHDAVAAGEARASLISRHRRTGGQAGIGRQTLAQIGLEGIDDRRSPARASCRPAAPGLLSDVGSDCLSIDAKLPRDRGDREALAVQI